MVPKGRLPVFSVDTEEEAQSLVLAACTKGYDDGRLYARELMEEQTLENLYAFGEKIASLHDRMVKRGTCSCRTVNRKSSKR